MNTISDKKLLCWSQKYNLENLIVAGYQGGYPIIQFKRRDDMPVVNMSKREINSIIRKAETYGGIDLGVVYNLRKTAFILVNDDTIVICGHEYVLDRILEKIF